jgi:hypothetical protein
MFHSSCTNMKKITSSFFRFKMVMFTHFFQHYFTHPHCSSSTVWGEKEFCMIYPLRNHHLIWYCKKVEAVDTCHRPRMCDNIFICRLNHSSHRQWTRGIRLVSDELYNWLWVLCLILIWRLTTLYKFHPVNSVYNIHCIFYIILICTITLLHV